MPQHQHQLVLLLLVVVACAGSQGYAAGDGLDDLLDGMTTSQLAGDGPEAISQLTGAGPEAASQITGDGPEAISQLTALVSDISTRQQQIQQLLNTVAAEQRSLAAEQSSLRGRLDVLEDRESSTPTPTPTPVVRQIPTRALGEACDNDADCGSVPGAACGSGGHCGCPHGVSTATPTQCQHHPALSEACASDDECRVLTEGAICAEGACTCPTGHRAGSNSTECRPLSPYPLGSCATDEDCALGLVCSQYGASGGRQCVMRECDVLSGNDEAALFETRPDSETGPWTPTTSWVAHGAVTKLWLTQGSSCDNGFVVISVTRTGPSGSIEKYGGSFVCADQWEEKHSNIVCRSLGFSTSVPVPVKSRFRSIYTYGTSGSLQHHDSTKAVQSFQGLVCNGDEADLFECGLLGQGNWHECAAGLAAVDCRNE